MRAAFVRKRRLKGSPQDPGLWVANDRSIAVRAGRYWRSGRVGAVEVEERAVVVSLGERARGRSREGGDAGMQTRRGRGLVPPACVSQGKRDRPTHILERKRCGQRRGLFPAEVFMGGSLQYKTQERERELTLSTATVAAVPREERRHW